MLKDKNIIVTGVSRGVGLELTELLLSRGANVYGISRGSSKDLVSLKEKYPDRLNVISFNLQKVEGIREEIFKAWIGFNVPIHGFVNNAANAYDDIITNLSLSRLQVMFEINVFSPMNIVKYVIRNMLLHRVRGSIIHISSISAHTGYKGLAMYASSKAALEGFSKNTAREWGERGVRSNCLVAGFMETSMSSTLTIEQKSRIFNRTSLKQPTSIRSVSEMVCFLLSDAAESVTGQNIHVDAGTI